MNVQAGGGWSGRGGKGGCVCVFQSGTKRISQTPLPSLDTQSCRIPQRSQPPPHPNHPPLGSPQLLQSDRPFPPHCGTFDFHLHPPELEQIKPDFYRKAPSTPNTEPLHKYILVISTSQMVKATTLGRQIKLKIK